MSDKNRYYDVIVAGGGLAGAAAAMAAAREGANVLIIEKYGFLGGMATAGLVNPFMPYCLWKGVSEGSWQLDWDHLANQGLFGEIILNLAQLDGLHPNHQTFNEEILKLVLDRMIKKYNVQVMFHSVVSSAERNGNQLESVTVLNKSGHTKYDAAYFIDATGDADLSALAECDYQVGRDSDHLCQPMTLCFRLANVDLARFSRPEADQKFIEFKNKGLIKNPRENILTFEHMVANVLHFNSTRIINKSATNAAELSQAEMEAREQVYELYRFMKENIAGFENCQLLMSATQIGIRESRRIVGEYTITSDDLLSAKKFEDSVARGTYPVDIHNPSGTGSILRYIPYGDYYTIPYRALTPKGIDNLITAGRPISSTHEAHASYRIMPICASIGEGAGSAAAIAVKQNIPFREVHPKDLHNLLDRYGALY
jgi:hypothetical protein